MHVTKSKNTKQKQKTQKEESNYQKQEENKGYGLLEHWEYLFAQLAFPLIIIPGSSILPDAWVIAEGTSHHMSFA